MHHHMDSLASFSQRVRGCPATKHRISGQCLEGLSVLNTMRQHECHNSQRFDTDSHFFLSLYSLSPIQIFAPIPTKLKNNLLTCWLFKFGLFFIIIFFYLKQSIKLMCLFNFIPITFFNLSNLIIILLIAIFFCFQAFFKLILFFYQT